MPDFPQCTAEQVLDAVEAVVLSNGGCDCKYVAAFLSHPEPAIEKALEVAVILGLLSKSGITYIAAAPYSPYLMEASEPRRIDLLRFSLEAYAPYRFFKQRLALHNDALRAARETKTRFSFDNHETEIRESLVSLGQYCGSLAYSPTSGLQVVLGSAGGEQYLASFGEISGESGTAEAFIRDRLGNAAYSYVQDESLDIVTNLRSAVQRLLAGESGTEILVFIGNACENFLAKLASDQAPPVSLAGANGVITKADKLRTAKVLAAKHLGFFQYLGNLRNAADHGIDPDVNAQWTIGEESVRQAMLICLSAMKSVVHYRAGQMAL